MLYRGLTFVWLFLLATLGFLKQSIDVVSKQCQAWDRLLKLSYLVTPLLSCSLFSCSSWLCYESLKKTNQKGLPVLHFFLGLHLDWDPEVKNNRRKMSTIYNKCHEKTKCFILFYSFPLFTYSLSIVFQCFIAFILFFFCFCMCIWVSYMFQCFILIYGSLFVYMVFLLLSYDCMHVSHCCPMC